MTYFIKTPTGDVLIEVETSKHELSICVNINIFAYTLLECVGDRVQQAFIKNVHDFSELRGEYYETPGVKVAQTPKEFIQDKCNALIAEWPHFSYNTD